MGTVVDFTQRKANKEVEEYEQDIDFADGLVDDIMDEFGAMLDEVGISERNDKLAKDFYYVMEGVRSLVYNTMDIDHPFQNIVDKMVECDYVEEEDSYYVSWKKPKKTLDIDDDVE